MTQSNAVSRVMLNLDTTQLTSVVSLKAQRGLAVTAPAKKTERSTIAKTSHEMFGVTMSPVVAEKTSMAVVVHGVAEVSVVKDSWDTQPIGTSLYVTTNGQFTYKGGTGAAVAGYFLQLHAHSTATMLLCPYRTHGNLHEDTKRKFELRKNAIAASSTVEIDTQSERDKIVTDITSEIGHSSASISDPNIEVRIASDASTDVLNNLKQALVDTKITRDARHTTTDVTTSDSVEAKAARFAEGARNNEVNKVYAPLIECLEGMIVHSQATVEIANTLNASTERREGDMVKAFNDQTANAANLPPATEFAALRSALEAFDVLLTKAYKDTRAHGAFKGDHWLLNLDKSHIDRFEKEQGVVVDDVANAKSATETATTDASSSLETVRDAQIRVKTSLAALNTYTFDPDPDVYKIFDEMHELASTWSQPRDAIIQLAADSIELAGLTNVSVLMKGMFSYPFGSGQAYKNLAAVVTTNDASFDIGSKNAILDNIAGDEEKKAAKQKAKDHNSDERAAVLALFQTHKESQETLDSAVQKNDDLNAEVENARKIQQIADDALTTQENARAQIDTLVRLGVTDRDMHAVFLGKNAPTPTKNVKPMSRKRRAAALNAVDDAMGGIRVTGDTGTDWQSTRNKHADLDQVHVFAAIATKNSIL